MKPLYVRVHPRDNVAIIVNDGGLSSGVVFPDGLVLAESIPQAHKVALAPIAAGEPICRYGEIIGRASRAIPRGAWVREEFVELPEAPPLDQIPLAQRSRPRSDHSRASPSTVIPMRTARPARATFWRLPPPCNASRLPWTSRSAESKLRSCRDTRELTESSR